LSKLPLIVKVNLHLELDKLEEYSIICGDMLTKIKKEFERFKRKLPFFGKVYKELERNQYKLNNLPYELYDKIKNGGFSVCIPIIKTADETIDKILQDKCSLSRFGDGEFGVMNGGHIHFQNRSAKLAQRLKEVIASDVSNLLIGLPDCFGSLDNCVPSGADFWRKWMSQKREMAYSYLDMNRVYYNAFFSRIYMLFNKTEEHNKKCSEYFEKIKKVWAGRDVIICEGEGTRFGMFNDLLSIAKSISRILCPAVSAFDKYDEVLSAFNDIGKDKLVLIALGPTATVLAYDLCNKGYQAIDIGHLDLEYERFLTRGTPDIPLKFKYIDSTKEGRIIRPLDNPEYKSQIIKKII
jgi:glycosyltransferase family protein